jgi:flagellar hook-basal body complex protein FliE
MKMVKAIEQMRMVLNSQSMQNKEALLKAIGSVRASIGNDFNAVLKNKFEELLQNAEANSDTYLNKFQKLSEQNEELKRQMSLKFNNL